MDILGAVTNTATVSVNGQAPYRKGEYYRKELALDNSVAATYTGVTNTATLGSLSVTNIGNLYLAQTPEAFIYDDDGNLTRDGRYQYQLSV